MKKKLILIGGGGHCKACIDVIEQTEQFEIVGILDVAELVGTNVLGYQIIGTDQEISKYTSLEYGFLITVGQVKSSGLREKIFQKLIENEAEIVTVIAKSALVSKYSKIGIGSIIMHNVLVNAGAKIGQNCILNNKCSIEHDTAVGNHTHISTGAIVNGGCNIGDGVFIGSNATIANQINVEDEAVVGAGSVVVKNVIKNDIQVGSPAKSIKK